MSGYHISVYVAVLAHDKGKGRLRVRRLRGVAAAVHMVKCVENCPKQAILSMTKILKDGRSVKIKHW